MTEEAVAWFFFFVFFTRTFSKGLDQFVQEMEWFEELSYEWAWVVKRILDLLHHWYVGYFIMIYAAQIATSGLLITLGIFPDPVVVYYIGLAIFLDDLPDVPPRLRKLFEGYGEWLKGE